MADFTGFPIVPTKERTPSRMSVLAYAPKTARTAASYAASVVVGKEATHTVVTIADNDAFAISEGDVILIYGSTDATYDGLHVASDVVAAVPSTSPAAFEIEVPFGADPAQGYVQNWTVDASIVGQAQDISGNQTFDTDDWSTIGTEQVSEPNDVSVPLSMNLFVDKSLGQSAGLLGVSDAQANAVRIDPTGANNVNVVMYYYDGRTSTSVVLHYTVYSNIQWNDWGLTQATEDYNQWAYTGDAGDVFARVPVIPTP